MKYTKYIYISSNLAIILTIQDFSENIMFSLPTLSFPLCVKPPQLFRHLNFQALYLSKLQEQTAWPSGY